MGLHEGHKRQKRQKHSAHEEQEHQTDSGIRARDRKNIALPLQGAYSDRFPLRKNLDVTLYMVCSQLKSYLI